jgi:hypothetical protein
MRTAASFLLSLFLGVWVGGIVFFSFVVAPAVFFTLPAQLAAGQIVSRCLAALHQIGLACGAIAFAATFLAELRRAKALRTLLIVMIAATAASHFGITPQMQRIRDGVGGPIEALPSKDSGRAAFDRLHQFSVVLEGIVLIAGLGALVVIASENSPIGGTRRLS